MTPPGRWHALLTRRPAPRARSRRASVRLCRSRRWPSGPGGRVSRVRRAGGARPSTRGIRFAEPGYDGRKQCRGKKSGPCDVADQSGPHHGGEVWCADVGGCGNTTSPPMRVVGTITARPFTVEVAASRSQIVDRPDLDERTTQRRGQRSQVIRIARQDYLASLPCDHHRACIDDIRRRTASEQSSTFSGLTFRE